MMIVMMMCTLNADQMLVMHAIIKTPRDIHPVFGFLGRWSMNGPLAFGRFLILGFPLIAPRTSPGVLARSLSTAGELLACAAGVDRPLPPLCAVVLAFDTVSDWSPNMSKSLLMLSSVLTSGLSLSLRLAWCTSPGSFLISSLISCFTSCLTPFPFD